MTGWLTEWAARFALHQPLWLLLLPLTWLAMPGRGQRAGGGRLARFADPHLLRWLTVERDDGRGNRAVRAAWLLVILALSGPHVQTGEDERKQRAADIAVVMDISPSMLTTDLETDRLGRARLELSDFIDRLDNDRTALVVYSAYAYTLLPLTHDHGLLRHYAGGLTPGLTRRRGSNLVQALERASQALDTTARRGRAIVLLSDGEAHDREAVLAAADRLRRRHIPVYALGLGTATGGPVPAPGGGYLSQDGEPVTSRLDRALLQALAARTGGRYADARRDDSDWERLLGGLDTLRRTDQTVRAAEPLLPLYPWLLAAALALLLWPAAGRVSARTVAPAAMVLALIPGESAATPWREQAAHEALIEGRYAEAAQLYRGVDSFAGALGRGAAAYRMREWPAALEAFAEAERRAADAAQRADALYNQGNTLIRMGRLEDAAQALERALELRPDHKAAGLNLALVNRSRSRARDGAENGPRRPGGDDNGGGTHDATPPTGDGGKQEAGLRRAVRRWEAAAGDTLSVTDPVRAATGVLQQRFMVRDTEHPLIRGTRPW